MKHTDNIQPNSKIDIDFNFDLWTNEPIRSLPYFDKINTLYSSLFSGGKFEIYCEYNGQRMFTITSDLWINSKALKFLVSYVKSIDKFIAIANYICIAPILPPIDDFNHEVFFDIDMIHSLVSKSEFRFPGNGRVFSIDLKPNENSSDLIKEESKEISEEIITIETEPIFSIFDHTVQLGKIQYMITEPKVILNKSQKLYHREYKNSFEMKIIGTINSEIVMTRLVEQDNIPN